MVLVKQLQGMGASPNLASLYSEFSTLYMLRSNYAEVGQNLNYDFLTSESIILSSLIKIIM